MWRNGNGTDDGINNAQKEEYMNTSVILAFVCVPSADYVMHMSLYVFIAFIGILGNASLMCVTLGHRTLRKNVDFLIFNLSVANILYIGFIVPIRMEHEINPCWLHNVNLCKLRYFIPTLLYSVVIFTLVSLSRERHVAVINRVPVSRVDSGNLKISIKIIIAIWMAALSAALPRLWLAGKPTIYMCTPFLGYHMSTFARVYDMCLLAILYVVPLGLISSHYIPLVLLLRRSSKMPEGRRHNAPATNKSRRQLIIIVLVITTAFAIFWLPHFLYSILFHYVDLTNSNTSAMVRHAIYYMQVMNSCFDPYVVFIMSSSHRRYLIEYTTCHYLREYISNYRTPSRSRSSTLQSMQMTQMTSTRPIPSRIIL